jgi:hypothetical protein
MHRSPLLLLTVAAVFGLAGCKSPDGKSDDPGTAEAETDKDRDRRTAAEKAFYEDCAELGAKGGVIPGRDGWLFDASELLRVSRITDSTATATGVIAEYAQQLRSQNIDLILVPVPPKSLVYPDKISRNAKVPMKSKRPARLDSILKSAMDDLVSKRVTVVDLLPVLIAHREEKAGTAYTRTGNTWSPYGVQIAVKEIANAVRSSRARGGSVTGITSEAATLEFAGNLGTGLAKAKTESLPAFKIGRISDGKVRSLGFNTSGGSLLLMGGPEILAWREANNPPGSSGAFCSLADQLAAELQLIPDVLANSNDARNAARLRILRERTSGHSMLGSTRTVVWVVPALDLCVVNWQRVPLQLQYSEDSPEIQLR